VDIRVELFRAFVEIIAPGVRIGEKETEELCTGIELLPLLTDKMEEQLLLECSILLVELGPPTMGENTLPAWSVGRETIGIPLAEPADRICLFVA